MLENVAMPVVHQIVLVIELIGVAIIVAGAAWTLVRFFFALARRDDTVEAVGKFRSSFGRALLMGLEFLVAADIINTVVIDLSLESVAALAAVVIIRTLLSFSLEAEIEGRWPWQRAGAKRQA